MLNHTQALVGARRYLRSKQTTLWGDWDLTHEDRLELAATWLADQVVAVQNAIAEAPLHARIPVAYVPSAEVNTTTMHEGGAAFNAVLETHVREAVLAPERALFGPSELRKNLPA